MTKPVLAPWIAYARPNPQAQLRLFCFPYAGGAASIFREWSVYLPNTIEVCPVQYPGREGRIRERAMKQSHELVVAIAAALRPYLDKPFAFWGHSMGALLSFEVVRQLRREKQPEPIHLFVSGHRAPHRPNQVPPIHQLPEDEFIKELGELNGTPEEVLRNKELMELLMPVLRSDFTLVETYTYEQDAPLTCTISAFGGLQDHKVSSEDLKAWVEQTTGSFRLRMFPGDHFFLHPHRTQLLSFTTQDLMPYLKEMY